MKICVECFSIFENERGFNDWKAENEYDGEFDSMEETIEHMDKTCALAGGGELILFNVEVVQ